MGRALLGWGLPWDRKLKVQNEGEMPGWEGAPGLSCVRC